MGRFLQELKDIEFKFVSAGVIKLNTPLSYITNNGAKINIPVGYKTDGYSKPQWTEWAVGGRFEDDIRPSTIHDYLCQFHGYMLSLIHI